MKKFVVTAVAAVSALAFAASALASTLPASHVLQFNGSGSHAWVKGDSPSDGNDKALRLHVGDPSAGGYVAVYSKRSINRSIPAEAMGSLSFDYAKRNVGAGAPRISVEFKGTSSAAFLAAAYCDRAIDSAWSRADFTRASSGCSIWFENVEYAADGTRSAWAVFTDAHPGLIVKQAYVVADESGWYRIDRLSLGTGVLYSAGNTVGKVTAN